MDLINKIKKSIRDIKKDEEIFPINDFPKHVMELIQIELIKDKGFEYDSSYSNLTKRLEKEEKHIIHKVMRLRKNNKFSTREDYKNFANEVEEYIIDLLRRVKEWK